MKAEQKAQALVEIAAESPHAPVALVNLPVGYKDPTTGEVWVTAQVREITGDEEVILADRSLGESHRLMALVANCLTALGPETDPRVLRGIFPRLQSADRIMLLFAVRRATLGPMYPFVEECPNTRCVDEHGHRTKSAYTVDLTSVETKPPELPRDTLEVVLSTKNKVVVRPLTGIQEDIIARFEQLPQAFLTLAARIVSWDGDPWDLSPTMGFKRMEARVTMLRKLSTLVLGELRDAAGRIEGAVDTSVDLECPLCGKTFRTEMSVQAGFFSRAATPKT